MKTDKLKNRISKLNVAEKKELINYIRSSYSVFNEYAKVEKCPHCQSNHIVKNGSRNSITRYLCRDCNKSFTYKSTTVLKGIQKLNKWNLFVEDFITLNISTIKDITKKLGISTQTAMDWRHKLLSALENRENKFVNETIEFDEAYMLISRKGRRNLGIIDKKAYRNWRASQVGDTDYNVKVFFTYGRENSHLDLAVSHIGRTSVNHLENYFLANRFKNITAYTDMHPSYKSYFNKQHIPFKTFKSTDHINFADKTVHNQTVNAYMRDFKKFVNKNLKGVSSKYIQSYAKWFEFIVNTKKAIQNQISKAKNVIFNLADSICENVLADNTGLELYRQSELSFLLFLKANGRTNHGDCKNHYYYNVA